MRSACGSMLKIGRETTNSYIIKKQVDFMRVGLLGIVSMLFFSSLTGCIDAMEQWEEGPDIVWIEIIYTQEFNNSKDNVNNWTDYRGYLMRPGVIDCTDNMRDGDEVRYQEPQISKNTKAVIIEYHPQLSGSHQDTLYWTFSDLEFEFQWNSTISNLTTSFNGFSNELKVNSSVLDKSDSEHYSEVVKEGIFWRDGREKVHADSIHNITITNHGVLQSYYKSAATCY
mgnify:FL=1